jgi:hypothetical protein
MLGLCRGSGRGHRGLLAYSRTTITGALPHFNRLFHEFTLRIHSPRIGSEEFLVAVSAAVQLVGCFMIRHFFASVQSLGLLFPVLDLGQTGNAPRFSRVKQQVQIHRARIKFSRLVGDQFHFAAERFPVQRRALTTNR